MVQSFHVANDGANLSVSIEGLTLVADHAGDEFRVRDVDLAERMGLARASNIRSVIAKAIDDRFLNENEDFRFCTPGVQNRRGRPVAREFWLTKRGSLKVIVRLNTPVAHAFTGMIIDVFEQATKRVRPSVSMDQVRELTAMIGGLELALRQANDRIDMLDPTGSATCGAVKARLRILGPLREVGMLAAVADEETTRQGVASRRKEADNELRSPALQAPPRRAEARGDARGEGRSGRAGRP